MVPLLRRVATYVLAEEAFYTGNLSIAVVGKTRIARLHKQFMNISGPTDVLTFDLGCDRANNEVEGEIVVCSDIALQNAGQQRAGAKKELALYVTHGILHLAGYDDQTDADYAKMHKREDDLLDAFGMGRVFSENVANRRSSRNK